MFEVDIGVAATLIAENTYKKQFSSKILQQYSMRLKTHTKKVQVLRQIVVDACYSDKRALMNCMWLRGWAVVSWLK